MTSKAGTVGPAKKTYRYLRLLVRSEPSKIDFMLLTTGLLAAMAAGVPFPLLGILFGELVDELNTAACTGSQNQSKGYVQSSVNTKVVLIVYVSVANFFAIYIHTGCWSLFGERLVRRLRENYFRGLLRQEVAFFDNMPAGDVAARLTSDIETIRSGVSEKVGIVISSFSYLLGAYIVAFIKNAKLAAILVSLIPAYIAMTVVGGKYVKKYTGGTSKYVGAALTVASECLSNVALVQALGADVRLEAKFSASLRKAQKEGLKKAIATASQFGLLFFIAYSANALAFWQGSRTIASSIDEDQSSITAGAVYTIIFLLVDASFIISQAAPFLQIFAAAAAASENLQTVIDRTSSIDGTSSSGGQYLEQAPPTIAFEGVSFHYPSRPESTVLQHISLEIPAAQHTAIVGPSGSGKSTIATLLTRLYDAVQGRIVLDGHDIRDINVRSLRNRIGVVQQDLWLLNRSILENIAHGLVNSNFAFQSDVNDTLLSSKLSEFAEAVRAGQDSHTIKERQGHSVASIINLVEEAAILADAHEFIQGLQYGYATMIGPTGVELSGGQKQRLALARALVKNPVILILDEATSALDTACERSIQTSLAQVIHGRTTISIAHRLSTLLKQKAVYAAMVNTQTVQPATSLRSHRSSTSSTAKYSDEIPDDSIQHLTIDKEAPIQADEIELGTAQHRLHDSLDTKRSLWSTMAGIAALSRPQLMIVFFGISAATIAGGAYSGEAVIFGHTIGSLSPCREAAELRASGSLYGLFGRLAEKMVLKVRVLAFRSLLHQDLQWHSCNGRTPALLMSYLSSDAHALAGLSGTTVGMIVSITVNLVAGILMTHIIAWKIAIVLLATLPVLLGSGIMRLRVLADLQARHQIAYATSVGITLEAVNSIKTVASLGLEEELLAVYKRSLTAPYKASFREIAYADCWLATAYSVSNLIYALAYWWGTKQVLAGLYSQTQFFIVLPALLFSAQSCGQMFALAPDLSNARVASARLLDLIDIGPDNPIDYSHIDETHLTDVEKGEQDVEVRGKTSSLGLTPPKQIGLRVQFHNVHFSYPGQSSQKILTGINITINPGQFCALVGPSGAGKSTILSLLERFYAPTCGTLTLDGRDVVDHKDVSFRNDIALVPQASILFDDTVRFNIALGARPGQEVSEEEIETACKLSNIHDTITALPEGYDTRCGANGERFSGGQRQRLSTARALIRQPRLLLLDEPTSALDAESEVHFQDTLERIRGSMTIIAVAHRLHTIIKAQTIFLIEGGRCVDQGSHADLCQRSSSYRANAAHQALDTSSTEQTA
ncbi:MAG: hypothetical protein Q9220_006926 [cf. Caloplaca sp. 1 TL-2023]